MESVSTTRVLRAMGFAALMVILLVAVSAARGAVDIEGLHDGLPDLDTRTTEVAPTAAQTTAAEQLGAAVSWNRFGTPSSVYNLDGNLATGIAAPTAVEAAQTWLDRNATLFGLSGADLTLVRDTPLADGGGHAVLLGQSFDGVLAAPDGLVTVAVVGSESGGWNVTYASSSLARNDSVANDYSLSLEQAWVEAANAIGEEVSTDDVSVAGKEDGWTELDVDGFDELQSVREAAFPVPGAEARAAFQTLIIDGDEVGYAQTVDASSGRILARTNTVDHAADNPAWKAFPAFPRTSRLNASPWNYPSTDTRVIWCWVPNSGCDGTVGNPANAAGISMPWDQTDPAGPSTFTTRGNNANSREQWITASSNPPRPAGTLFQPTSATRDYVFPWTNVWFTSKCDPANLVDPATGQPRAGTGNDIAAAVTNLFAMHNRVHDWAYHLGFTEAAWNGQQNNFTTPPPFLGNDPLTGNAQAGAITGGFPGFAGRDNANMNTQRDGTPSVTNMFLWQPIAGSFYAPCVDGDYDMSVIAHEYGHMIENRMIGKGFRRAGEHAGAMGESFADLAAAEYLNANHDVPVSGINPFLVGPYVTGNPITGIRNYAMNWPMSGEFPSPGRKPQVNALNLGDYEYDLTGQQVHSDGEIWSAANYTLRQLFLNRYRAHSSSLDRRCAIGQVPVTQCPGNQRWIQLYFDAMLLMPTGPSLIDARNAILAADQTRFGGANQDLLWRGFAERGFGQFATTTDANDDNPIPDFSSPYEQNATVTFKAVTKDSPGRGTPVNATVYVGDYEARVTQIADTVASNDPAVTPSNLDAAAPFVATHDRRGDGHNLKGGRNDHGRGPDRDGENRHGDDNGAGYNFVALAPGYGHVRFRIDDLRPGENRVVTIEFPRNVASATGGATASGDGTDQANLIDETEGTQWTSIGTTDVAGRQVLITLAGRQTFKVVKVSALLGPGQNRFTALRSFEILACDAGRTTCDPANAAGWKRVLGSDGDAFPSVNPRPIAPDLIMRAWKVQTTKATHVLFRVRTNQCSGQRSYQGEQDNDPTYSTDCRVTSLTPTGTVALPARNTDVRAAEVELLSDEPEVRGADEENIGRNDHDDD